MSDKVLVDRELLERLQERLDPHRDAVDWGMVCDAFRPTHPAPDAEAVEAMPVRWTGNPDADLALVLIDRIDAPEDESRLDQLEQIVMRLGKAATVPAGCKVVPVELLQRVVDYYWGGDGDMKCIAQDCCDLLEVKP